MSGGARAAEEALRHLRAHLSLLGLPPALLRATPAPEWALDLNERACRAPEDALTSAPLSALRWRALTLSARAHLDRALRDPLDALPPRERPRWRERHGELAALLTALAEARAEHLLLTRLPGALAWRAEWRTLTAAPPSPIEARAARPPSPPPPP
ncbi:MAG: hypothetical protein FJ138_16595, partial [Deltaproteobacteria bacterium]|nr:hypothetical protein [Deltaproteobacteria bacterium]